MPVVWPSGTWCVIKPPSPSKLQRLSPSQPVTVLCPSRLIGMRRGIMARRYLSPRCWFTAQWLLVRGQDKQNRCFFLGVSTGTWRYADEFFPMHGFICSMNHYHSWTHLAITATIKASRTRQTNKLQCWHIAQGFAVTMYSSWAFCAV